MEAREIASGTRVLVGAPARPMPQAQAAAIADALSRVGGVREAHLPQLYAPGAMDEPSQVLVVVLEEGRDPERLAREISCALAGLLTEGSRLDIFPLTPASEMLTAVRGAGCRILGATQDARKSAKSWWKFWRR